MQADTDKTLRLLRTARGQIDGIIRMVEADRYCIDISTQLMATVAGALASGTPEEKVEKLDEIERVIDKLAK